MDEMVLRGRDEQGCYVYVTETAVLAPPVFPVLYPIASSWAVERAVLPSLKKVLKERYDGEFNRLFVDSSGNFYAYRWHNIPVTERDWTFVVEIPVNVMLDVFEYLKAIGGARLVERVRNWTGYYYQMVC